MNKVVTSPRIAVIGGGLWGRNLIRNFHELGVLETFNDHHAENVAQLEASYGLRSSSYEQILSNPKIDAVVVAVPTIHHFDVAEQVLKAGKHIYIEKPVTMSLKETETLVALAADNELCFMVGHLPRYHAAFQALLELKKLGSFGPLRYVTSNRLNLGRVRCDENCLWDLAPHDVSMLLALVGDDVVDSHTHYGQTITPDIIDTALVSLTFANGVKGHIFNTWMHPYKEHVLTVVGQNAMAVFNDTLPWDKKLAIYEHKVSQSDDARYHIEKAEPRYINIQDSEPLKDECRHFVQCLKTGQAPLTGPQEALRVMRVLDRIQPNL